MEPISHVRIWDFVDHARESGLKCLPHKGHWLTSEDTALIQEVAPLLPTPPFQIQHIQVKKGPRRRGRR